MVLSLIKGLQRKRGYFNLDGDTERQMQDFEQDTDDSLRALSDQIDRVRTEAVESKEETQAEVKRVSEETAGQNTRISELDDRVTALENPPAAPYLYAQLDDGAYAQNTNIPLTESESRGDISVGANTVTVNEDGLYTITLATEAQSSSSVSPREISIDLQRSGVTVSRMNNTRWSTSTSDLVLIEAAWTGHFTNGQTIRFSCASGGTTTIAGGSLIRSNVTIAKVGE